MSDVLTVDEGAALLRVGRKSLYAAIDRGEVPGVVRIGRTIRLSRAALQQWFSASTGTAQVNDERPASRVEGQ